MSKNGERGPNSKVDLLIQTIEVSAPVLMSAALVAMRNKEEAEDAVQETYLKAFRGLENFRGDSQMKTWLYRILKNNIKDKYAAKQARPTEVQLDQDWFDGHVDDSPGPYEAAVNEEELEQMIKEMRSVPAPYQAETLMYIYGFKHREIAEQLGKPVGTVKCYAFRGREIIRNNRTSEGD